jgi:hypothetical protein
MRIDIRGHRATEFDRRSALYTRLDGQLYAHTRFFAAAALVNAVLARRFKMLFAIRSSPGFDFLNDVGAALESDNLAHAGEITRYTPGAHADHALVRAEQARLQSHVLARQVQQPRHWESVRRELNGLLNQRHAISLFSRWCAAGAQVSQVLQTVRGHLGKTLDFAIEAHRVCIGLALIEHIRREGALPDNAQPDPAVRAARSRARRALPHPSMRSGLS